MKYNKNKSPQTNELMKFEERKKELDKKTLPTQIVDEWEIAMWDDIA